MPAERTIWEKLSILTSFFGGLTALIVALVALAAVFLESGKSDTVAGTEVAESPPSAVSTPAPSPAVASAPPASAGPISAAAAAEDLPPTAPAVLVTGWASLGSSKVVSKDGTKVVTFKRDTNLRSDYPRFPFYRFGDRLGLAREGVTGEVLEVRENIGAGNHTWAFVEVPQ